MKKLIGLIALLMLSCTSFSQTVTADSMMMPKVWLKKTAADLLRYDDCRQEVKTLRPYLDAQRRYISQLEADTLAKAERISVLDSRLTSAALLSQQLEANCNDRLKDFEKQLRRQKRRQTWQTVLIAVGAAGAGYFIHSIAR